MRDIVSPLDGFPSPFGQRREGVAYDGVLLLEAASDKLLLEGGTDAILLEGTE